jgi:hypothetical protein
MRRLRAAATTVTAVAALTAGLILVTSPATYAATNLDITDVAGTLTDQYGTTGVEGADKAIDSTPYTKYFTPHSTTWLQYAAQTSATVTRYTVTSANDAPDRDPKSWLFQASTTGATGTWVTLNSQSNQTFINRFQQKSYTFTNATAYRFYRLTITATAGSPEFQIGEWQIFGSTTATVPQPDAPSGLAVQSVSGDQIVVTWQDNTRWETRYRLERSTDGITWSWSKNLPVGTTRYYDLGLTGLTQYFYRVRAENGTGTSSYTAVANTRTLDPNLPTSWQEHWFEHNMLVNRVDYNSDMGLYFDNAMDANQKTWVSDFITRLWRYTKQNYGSFSNPRLAAVIHGGANLGGHADNVFSSLHDYRNTIDVSLLNWDVTNAEARDDVSHEMGHVVESASLGVHGSPAFALWRDSKWNEIFQYDAYLRAGFTSDATRWHDKMMVNPDQFPRANTFWFRDWFYPIWHDHGGSATLARYYQLLSANFPQFNGEYARDLNWGEFVHFWSGAAGVNLKPLATAAFGWPTEWEQQFVQARQDFPGVTYV